MNRSPASIASCAARAELICSSKKDAGGLSRSDDSFNEVGSSVDGGGTLYSVVGVETASCADREMGSDDGTNADADAKRTADTANGDNRTMLDVRSNNAQ